MTVPGVMTLVTLRSKATMVLSCLDTGPACSHKATLQCNSLTKISKYLSSARAGNPAKSTMVSAAIFFVVSFIPSLGANVVA